MPISTHSDKVALYGGDPEHFIHVLECLHVPAVEAAGFEPIRPSAEGSSMITPGIIQNLASVDMVLCDVSCFNPNVFFEWGIRTALNKPIALVKDSRVEELPFDTGQLHHETYEASLAGWVLEKSREVIAAHIRKTAEQSVGRNPLWRYYGVADARLEATVLNRDEKLDLLINQIPNLIEQAVWRATRKQSWPPESLREAVNFLADQDAEAPPGYDPKVYWRTVLERLAIKPSQRDLDSFARRLNEIASRSVPPPDPTPTPTHAPEP